MSLNTLAISGNVGRDPEVKYFESSKVKASFSVAVQGYSKDETNWVNIEAWGKTAEFVGNYVRKGSLVLVSGRLKEERWEKDGQQRSRLIVVADRVESPRSANNSDQGFDDDEIAF